MLSLVFVSGFVFCLCYICKKYSTVLTTYLERGSERAINAIGKQGPELFSLSLPPSLSLLASAATRAYIYYLSYLIYNK